MNMLAMLLSAVFLSGAAPADTKPTTQPVANDEKGTQARAETMEAEVVSADPTGKTLTIKTDLGDNKTLSVDAKALTTLKTVKAGDKVSLKVSNNAVTEIKTKAGTAPQQPPMN